MTIITFNEYQIYSKCQDKVIGVLKADDTGGSRLSCDLKSVKLI